MSTHNNFFNGGREHNATRRTNPKFSQQQIGDRYRKDLLKKQKLNKFADAINSKTQSSATAHRPPRIAEQGSMKTLHQQQKRYQAPKKTR